VAAGLAADEAVEQPVFESSEERRGQATALAQWHAVLPSSGAASAKDTSVAEIAASQDDEITVICSTVHIDGPARRGLITVISSSWEAAISATEVSLVSSLDSKTGCSTASSAASPAATRI
jgi:hypothetical protein